MLIALQEDGVDVSSGAEPDISFGGATGGASFATRGAVNGLCRTFRKRPEKFGAARQNFGGAVGPLAPPSSAPVCYGTFSKIYMKLVKYPPKCSNLFSLSFP